MHKDHPKILILATTASMIEQFNMHNIKILQSLGAEVHVGSNFHNPGTITKSISNELTAQLEDLHVRWHQVDFMRGIGTHRANKRALNQVCQIIRENGITGIHAHSPLGGIIGRRAAHRMHVKIIYTAHGFQFFKGGPLKNWLFFPIEWFYARWTDALITINKQDYAISKYLPVKHRYYIPGVGIDINDSATNVEKEKIRLQTRKRLSVNPDDFLVISVGELNDNKNHITVLKAIAELKNPKIKYVIAGIGPKKEDLIKAADNLHLNNQFELLGYINNVQKLYYAADLNVFVSKREGLGLGGLEGVAHGLYIIGNARTGMKDYIKDEHIGLLIDSPLNYKKLARLINKVYKEKRTIKNIDVIQKFSHENVDSQMRKIYIKEFFKNLTQ